MNTHASTFSRSCKAMSPLIYGIALALGAGHACAEEPSSEQGSGTVQPTVNNAVNVARDALKPHPTLIPRTPTVNPLAENRPGNTGQRALKSPGSCVPKANSLDCADGDGQGGGGANVSDRVRSGVIGEVGRGRAATEGAGGAQRQETCTPEPGKLTCAP